MSYRHFFEPVSGRQRIRWGRTFTVDVGERGVLFVNGVRDRILEPGRYRLWTRHAVLERVDVRERVETLANQELITVDHAPIRMTLFLSYRVEDPARYVEAAQDVQTSIYAVAQLSARDLIATMSVEELLDSRGTLPDRLMETLGDRLSGYGVKPLWFQVRDLMLPGEFKKAFGAVLLARQAGLAALERARGETAALRNLANAASLFRDHPQLLTLRAIQAIEQGQGGTIVFGRNDDAALPPPRS